jgi:hypothetical protein
VHFKLHKLSDVNECDTVSAANKQQLRSVCDAIAFTHCQFITIGMTLRAVLAVRMNLFPVLYTLTHLLSGS